MPKKKGKRNKKKEEQDSLLKEDILKKLDSISKDADKEKPEHVTIHLYHTIREFFEGYFNIKYEFTYEELIDEIKHKRGLEDSKKTPLIKFARKMLAKEYSEEKSTSSKELKSVIREFKKLVSISIKTGKDIADEKAKEGSLIEGVMKTLKSIRLRPRSTNEEAVKIFKLIDKTKPLLNEKEVGKAKRYYKKAMAYYKVIQPNHRKEVYGELGEVYKEIIKIEIDKKLKNINQALVEINDSINSEKIGKAKNQYKKLLNMYMELPEKEQKKVYKNVMQFYEKLSK